MNLEEINKFWSNLSWFDPFETWNHIKIFTKLGGSFKNQVPFDFDSGPGIRYESIAHVPNVCLFALDRIYGWKVEMQSKYKKLVTFFDPHRPE